jgi:hypothetical protein
MRSRLWNMQLMKSLGVVADDDDDDDDDSSNIKIDGKNIESHTFVEEIYLNSNNLDILPSIIYQLAHVI